MSCNAFKQIRKKNISKEINKLLKDTKYIDDILESGSLQAEKIAQKKVNDIKQKIGF